MWIELLLFVLTGYNVLADSGHVFPNKQDVACDGRPGSSIVFSSQTDSDPQCDQTESDPFNLKTCAQAQAVQLAFLDRQSFSLWFGVHCEDNHCGRESREQGQAIS